MNNNNKRKSFLQIVFDTYWYIKKRIRVFFMLTTVVLIIALSLLIYLDTHSFRNIWFAFLVGPGIMLFLFIGYKMQQYEDKHDLTHYKFYNGGFIRTTFPMRKHTKKKK